MSETNNLAPQFSMSIFKEIDDLIAKNEIFIDVRNDPMMRDSEDNFNNIEISDQKLLLPTDSFIDMITNGNLASNQFSLLQPSSSDVAQNNLFRSSTIIPSNVQLPGDYNFQVHLVSNAKHTKSVPWAYSENLNKLFCKMGISCPINIQIDKAPPQGSIVRFTPMYSRFEHAQENVVRCANHIMCKDFNNNGYFSRLYNLKKLCIPYFLLMIGIFLIKEHPAPSHFVRVDNRNAVYDEDANTGRQSVWLPFELPQS